MRNNPWVLTIVFFAAVTGLLVFLSLQFPGVLDNEDNLMRLVYLSILLAAIAGGRFVGYRGGITNAIKQALAWIAVAMVLVLGYSYRFELEDVYRRVSGEVVPSRGYSEAPGVVSLLGDNRGHFIADAYVYGASDDQGSHVRFLVDTGASTVALPRSDARRLGFDVDALRFTVPVSTANGQTFAASVRLNSIEIGDIIIPDVQALVMPDRADTPLLGMSFLRRLSSFEVSGNQLILSN